MSGGFRSRSKSAQQNQGAASGSSRGGAQRGGAQRGGNAGGNGHGGASSRNAQAAQHSNNRQQSGQRRGTVPHKNRNFAQGKNSRGHQSEGNGAIMRQVQGKVDLPRKVALEVLVRVNEQGAYANLLLPKLLKECKLRGRDAAFATEITYGTLRHQGICDAIISDCATRELESLHPVVRNSLRLGIYQLLYTRVGAHAAVDSTVEMVDPKARGFCNAIMRKVSRHDKQYWLDTLAPADELEALAWQHAHPAWIARSFARILPAAELEAALAADSERPVVHIAAKPQELSQDELVVMTGASPAQYSPYGAYLEQGVPGELDVIRQGLAIVQDEGSQLIARAVAKAPVDVFDDQAASQKVGTDELSDAALAAGGDSNAPARWLDLCAGPGGKATMLGALAQGHATLDAVEVSEHRARLVEQATQGLPVTVHNADGRNPGVEAGFERILVDAPCSGLGALRRRPEARWRKSEADILELNVLQYQLLSKAYELLRPGGALIYSTCSPDLRETRDIVDKAVRQLGAVELDAHLLAPELPADAQSAVTGKAIQLWPHRHGTDAMFFAWLTKPAS